MSHSASDTFYWAIGAINGATNPSGAVHIVSNENAFTLPGFVNPAATPVDSIGWKSTTGSGGRRLLEHDRLEDLADVDSFIGHRHEPSKDGDNHRKLLMHVHTGLSHAHSPHTPAGYVDISISCSPASEAPPDPIGCEECLPVECDPGYKRQGLCNTHLGDLPTIPGVTYGDVARTCAAVSLRSGWRLPLSLCTTLPLTVPVDPTIPS